MGSVIVVQKTYRPMPRKVGGKKEEEEIEFREEEQRDHTHIYTTTHIDVKLLTSEVELHSIQTTYY